jgi:hypothetical protein
MTDVAITLAGVELPLEAALTVRNTANRIIGERALLEQGDGSLHVVQRWTGREIEIQCEGYIPPALGALSRSALVALTYPDLSLGREGPQLRATQGLIIDGPAWTDRHASGPETAWSLTLRECLLGTTPALSVGGVAVPIEARLLGATIERQGPTAVVSGSGWLPAGLSGLSTSAALSVVYADGTIADMRLVEPPTETYSQSPAGPERSWSVSLRSVADAITIGEVTLGPDTQIASREVRVASSGQRAMIELGDGSMQVLERFTRREITISGAGWVPAAVLALSRTAEHTITWPGGSATGVISAAEQSGGLPGEPTAGWSLTLLECTLGTADAVSVGGVEVPMAARVLSASVQRQGPTAVVSGSGWLPSGLAGLSTSAALPLVYADGTIADMRLVEPPTETYSQSSSGPERSWSVSLRSVADAITIGEVTLGPDTQIASREVRVASSGQRAMIELGDGSMQVLERFTRREITISGAGWVPAAVLALSRTAEHTITWPGGSATGVISAAEQSGGLPGEPTAGWSLTLLECTLGTADAVSVGGIAVPMAARVLSASVQRQGPTAVVSGSGWLPSGLAGLSTSAALPLVYADGTIADMRLVEPPTETYSQSSSGPERSWSVSLRSVADAITIGEVTLGPDTQIASREVRVASSGQRAMIELGDGSMQVLERFTRREITISGAGWVPAAVLALSRTAEHTITWPGGSATGVISAAEQSGGLPGEPTAGWSLTLLECTLGTADAVSVGDVDVPMDARATGVSVVRSGTLVTVSGSGWVPSGLGGLAVGDEVSVVYADGTIADLAVAEPVGETYQHGDSGPERSWTITLRAVGGASISIDGSEIASAATVRGLAVEAQPERAYTLLMLASGTGVPQLAWQRMRYQVSGEGYAPPGILGLSATATIELVAPDHGTVECWLVEGPTQGWERTDTGVIYTWSVLLQAQD